MKRTLITATMIITTLITAAGQSQDPGEISLKWNEIRQLCEKYDNGTDSAYRILNEQLVATRRDPVANAGRAEFLTALDRVRDADDIRLRNPVRFRESRNHLKDNFILRFRLEIRNNRVREDKIGEFHRLSPKISDQNHVKNKTFAG